MINAFKTSIILVLFGLRLPFVVWTKSKQKLSLYPHLNHEEILDDEYIVTSWLDWMIDCVIFFTYPLGLLIVLIILIATKAIPVLFAFIPIYFFPLFISFMRELGGSLMLLHMNVRKIEKNTHKEDC